MKIYSMIFLVFLIIGCSAKYKERTEEDRIAYEKKRELRRKEYITRRSASLVKKEIINENLSLVIGIDSVFISAIEEELTIYKELLSLKPEDMYYIQNISFEKNNFNKLNEDTRNNILEYFQRKKITVYF